MSRCGPVVLRSGCLAQLTSRSQRYSHQFTTTQLHVTSIAIKVGLYDNCLKYCHEIKLKLDRCAKKLAHTIYNKQSYTICINFSKIAQVYYQITCNIGKSIMVYFIRVY